jgi:hypothetical protein
MATSPVSASAAVNGRRRPIARGDVSRVSVVRWALLLAYAGFAVGMFAVRGIPFDREQLILWVCGALVLVCIGRPPREIARLARDWFPFALILIAYDYTRGLADTLGMPVHVVGATIVYHTHFFAVYVIAGVLWARNRARFGAFVRRFLALTFAGLATYVLFPAAPPWMASRDGEIGAVVRASGKGWSALGLSGAEALLHKGQAVVNQVAAFTMLVCVFFWAGARWPLRIVLAAYPVAMGFALVYSAEHYAADVLLGWVYVAFVMVGVAWCERWWRERQGDPLFAERG